MIERCLHAMLKLVEIAVPNECRRKRTNISCHVTRDLGNSIEIAQTLQQVTQLFLRVELGKAKIVGLLEITAGCDFDHSNIFFADVMVLLSHAILYKLSPRAPPLIWTMKRKSGKKGGNTESLNWTPNESGA